MAVPLCCARDCERPVQLADQEPRNGFSGSSVTALSVSGFWPILVGPVAILLCYH